MAMSKFVPGHCGTGDCGCGSCTGTVCVALAGPCLTTDRAGVLVTVKDHATGVTAGTATTDAGGSACVSGLAPGTYDVVPTKTNCFIDSWLSQTLTCSTLNLAGNVTCLPYGARKFTVLGCFGTVLPDAVISITGAATATVQTDSTGVAYYHYIATGTYTAVISHPSGRFADSSPVSWTVANVCDQSTADPVTLAPATGYYCCDVQRLATPPSPYPIATTLKVTDPGGAISFTATNCSGTACGTRTMGDCSPSGLGFATCGGNGYSMPPTDIGSFNCKASYNVSLSNTTVSCVQSNPIFDSTGGGLQYPPGAPTDCTLKYRAWRVSQSDCAASAYDKNFASTGYTINSLYPLNITFTFASGGTFGPSATSITQYPAYATSVVVSE